MTLAGFQSFVASHADRFRGVRPLTTSDFDQFESELGHRLPEAMRWLLGSHGYSDGCGVANLDEAVAQTLACRRVMSLPAHWLILNDRGDAGAVLLDMASGSVCWYDEHDIQTVVAGEPVPAADWFNGYAEWAVHCACSDEADQLP